MANIRNIDAETGANYIGDDTEPTLTITNSSTGAGLQTDRLVATSSATIAAAELVGASRIVGNTSTAIPMTFTRATLAGPTAPLARVVSSIASGPVFQLDAQSFVSAVSIVFGASGNWAGLGAIPVKRSDGTIAFIPVLPPAVVTAAAFA